MFDAFNGSKCHYHTREWLAVWCDVHIGTDNHVHTHTEALLYINQSNSWLDTRLTWQPSNVYKHVGCYLGCYHRILVPLWELLSVQIETVKGHWMLWCTCLIWNEHGDLNTTRYLYTSENNGIPYPPCEPYTCVFLNPLKFSPLSSFTWGGGRKCG